MPDRPRAGPGGPAGAVAEVSSDVSPGGGSDGGGSDDSEAVADDADAVSDGPDTGVASRSMVGGGTRRRGCGSRVSFSSAIGPRAPHVICACRPLPDVGWTCVGFAVCIIAQCDAAAAHNGVVQGIKA